MNGRPFIDTNVFFYAFDQRDPDKRDKARELLRRVAAERTGVVSSQVVLELAANFVRKLGLSRPEAATQLRVLDLFECVPLTPDVVRNALRLQAQYSLSVWDSAIVAAALHGKCRILYSENLQDGQVLDGLKVRNPFR